MPEDRERDAAGHAAKAALKRCVKAAAGLAGPLIASRHPDSRILTYHSVGHRAHEMNVTPDAFRAQMAWLADHFSVIPLAAAAKSEAGVALTFDDGYRDNLVNAAPVLESLGLPATVFVVPGRLGGLLDHDRDPETSRLLTWNELEELEAAGVGAGAHTMTHRRLSTLSAAEQREEIGRSGEALAERLGHPIRAFAYPFGAATDYTALSMRLVREAGFDHAVSNRYGRNRPGADRWALRRIWIDASDSLATFQAKVTGRLDLLTLLDSAAGAAARRIINRALRA
jgi:peptidoglycan/xylan/chitin deacetylase (PgdA/CDA1 family)